VTRGAPIALTLALVVALAGIVLSHVRIRTDITDLLPPGRTEIARFMLRELRSGAATNLILIGIDGAQPRTLARASRDLTARLRNSGLFELVNNGDASLLSPDEQDFLLRNRYLLSPDTRPESFTTEALHQDMLRLLEALQSSAAPLVSHFGLRDLSGALKSVANTWIGASEIHLQDSVWFAGDRNRALILAKTRARGMDTAAQIQIAENIRAAFAQSAPAGATLRLTGSPIFAADAARTIETDVEHLSLLSISGILLLLLWRFRSGWVIAAIAIPVALGIGVAALAVQLVFGFVHAVALGFGITMLGVSIDYPVLLIGHRKLGEAASGTLRRIGRAFTLAVATAVLGLTSMLFTGLSGLSQLGVFAVVGLLSAAAATRWLLPPLIVRTDLAPVSAGDPATLLRIERLRAGRIWAVLLCVACALYLVVTGGPAWEHDLAAFSPVPPASLALDAELRHEIGAPEPGQIGLVQGNDAESVLRAEERLLPALNQLRQSGTLASVEIAAPLLPTTETQLTRRAALPEPADLARRVDQASAGLPFRPGAFQPFIDDVTASRTQPPVAVADITSPLIRARLAPLLFERDGIWYGLIIPSGLQDPIRLETVLHGAGAQFIDMAQEANRIVADYTRAALRWIGAGGVAALICLAIGVRDIRRVARISGAVAASVLLTVTLLAFTGNRLSLIHLVALQFVAGIGLDYAVFFARPQLDEEERARTLRTLFTCNAMAILTFGLLAMCRTPLLHQLGLTVLVGAVAALAFGFLFAGPRPRPEGNAI
jgi:predicted exporter